MKGRDITNHKFNKLTAISVCGKDKWGNYRWLFKCECGNEKIIPAKDVRRGLTKSCGCIMSESHMTHRMHGTRPYSIWAGMKNRCNNNINRYAGYNGRGITYNHSWEKFENFWEDMKESYSDGLTLDRVDNNGPYSKENCRWATMKEQSRNTRKNKYITYMGKKYLFLEFCEKFGLSYISSYQRLYRGWSLDEVIKISNKTNIIL